MLIVFGSINMDFYSTVAAMPQPGETVLSPRYDTHPGGKGANQALAAAMTGAKTAIIGKIGDDGMGQRILTNLRRHEVMTSGVARSESLPTGMASVIRNQKGEKFIIASSGANAEVKADQVPDDILHDKNMVLLQMELPLVESVDVMVRAKEHGAKVILNLAPAIKIPTDALKLVDTLIVNQIEARQLARSFGMDDTIDLTMLARALQTLGDMNCIVTLGGKGLVAVEKSGEAWAFKSMKLEEVVDTAGAGDCFCGTLAAMMHNGADFLEAVHTAIVAAGLSCTKEGIQDSYPFLADVKDNLDKVEKPQQL
jgi:ribokinase